MRVKYYFHICFIAPNIGYTYKHTSRYSQCVGMLIIHFVFIKRLFNKSNFIYNFFTFRFLQRSLDNYLIFDVDNGNVILKFIF